MSLEALLVQVRARRIDLSGISDEGLDSLEVKLRERLDEQEAIAWAMSQPYISFGLDECVRTMIQRETGGEVDLIF